MIITKGSNSITIKFVGDESKILSNDLLDPFDWVEQMMINKLFRCKERLINEWTNKFLTDKSVETIPTDGTLLLEMIFNHPDYKNRQEREADLEKSLGQKAQ